MLLTVRLFTRGVYYDDDDEAASFFFFDSSSSRSIRVAIVPARRGRGSRYYGVNLLLFVGVLMEAVVELMR